MLRSVCFKNFVNFKDKQFLDFQGAGPFIFIGENGAGKSSVLEGIRRCLQTKLSTSVSSSFQNDEISYFICIFETDPIKKEKNATSLNKDNPSRKENETDSLKKEQTNNDPSGEEKETDSLKEEDTNNDPLEKEKGTDSLEKEKVETDLSKNGNETDHLLKENETDKKEYVISGVVALPTTSEHRACYKFSMYHPDRSESMQKHLIHVNTTNQRMHVHAVTTYLKENDVDLRQKFLKAIFENTRDIDECVKTFFLSEFDPTSLEISIIESEIENGPLNLLTNKVVFTFSLRTIGPLQWSESERISHDKREDNYVEAERRCEIIKSFLNDKNQTRFDQTREDQIFKALTKSDDYKFELIDGGSDGDSRLHLNGNMFALLKAPEGILEAKAFSILMSGKQYRTVILEEPDRGMHPQFVERMVHLIKHQSDKRIILTTHNTAFISPWTLSDCFIFRRRMNKECFIVSGKIIAKDNTKKTKIPDKKRIASNTDEVIFMKTLRLLTSDHFSDILLAKKILFCEGDTEFLFMTELKHQILSGTVNEIDIFSGDIFVKEKLEDSLVELSIIKLNGKGNTDLFLTVSKLIELDAIFLVDKQADGLPEKHENEPNVFIWKDGDIEDMVIIMCMESDDGSDNDSDKLKSKLIKQNVTVNYDKLHKSKKNAKLFLRENVSIANISEGVKLILEHCKPKSDLVSFIKFLYLGKAQHCA